ncbi:Unknown protein sequence [Pseudomonas amygdali pv. mellea]|nr:Unknown protein sequence [Pseudomonas amygdali pv. mellea]
MFPAAFAIRYGFPYIFGRSIKPFLLGGVAAGKQLFGINPHQYL